MDAQTSNYPWPLIIRWMSSNIRSAVVFVRWKANFLGCQRANKKQTHTVTLHQAAGLSAGEEQRERQEEWHRQGSEEKARHFALFFFFFLLPYNKVWKDSLCIRLINSYSSSAWHLGNRSGFALGLIFRPVEDSQSIRALFRLHTTNFLDLPKKQGEKRKKIRVIEEGIDDIQGEMEGR